MTQSEEKLVTKKSTNPLQQDKSKLYSKINKKRISVTPMIKRRMLGVK